MISSLLLALAISTDGFLAGFAYGLRRVRIPFLSVLTVSLTSAGVILLSMQAGELVSRLLSPVIAHRLGAGIMVLVGLWVIYQSLSGGSDVKEIQRSEPKNKETERVLSLRLAPFGLVIHILREPLSADFDASGVVSGWEAFALGVALALDAMGAGIGAAMTGLSIPLTSALVGITKFVVLTAGVALGQKHGAKAHATMMHYLPGTILVSLGVWWLFV